MKKALSLFLAILMLTTLFVPVSAADSTVIDPEVPTSITEATEPEDNTGLGLAFMYTMHMQNVITHSIRSFQSATITVDGEECKVIKLGAVVTNIEETGKDPDAMVIENVTGIHLLNVEGKKLLDDWTDAQLQFAVRVTNIPEEFKKTQIYARPYYIYENKAGEQQTVYGDITNKSYFSRWCDSQPAVTLPSVGEDFDVTKKKGRIFVTDASIVDRTVTLTVTNKSTNWITEETDTVKVRCTNAAGKKIKDITIYIGCIDTKKNKTKSFTFEVPDETAKVRLYSSVITYWTEWS